MEVWMLKQRDHENSFHGFIEKLACNVSVRAHEAFNV